MKWFVESLLMFALVLAWALSAGAADQGSSGISTPVAPRVFRPAIRTVALSRDLADPSGTTTEEPQPAPPAATITPHTPVHYRLATWDIWGGTYNGYIYAPGSCDYTPPCVAHLWDGYCQKPLRCYQHHSHCGGINRYRCDSCNEMSSCGTSSGCDSCSGCMRYAHGWHFGRKMYGCSSCVTAAPSCGCEAGSIMTAPAAPGGEVPPQPMPTTDFGEKSARGYKLRGFGSWPTKSLQR